MFALCRLLFSLVMLLLSGVIAAKLTIPLLASWFGITITIAGSTPVVGMYLFFVSSFIVVLGLLVELILGIAALAFVSWLCCRAYKYYK